MPSRGFGLSLSQMSTSTPPSAPPMPLHYVRFWSVFFRDLRIGAPLRFLFFVRVWSRDGRRGQGVRACAEGESGRASESCVCMWRWRRDGDVTGEKRGSTHNTNYVRARPPTPTHTISLSLSLSQGLPFLSPHTPPSTPDT